MIPLAEKISELARAPILLVASDFDGTLAPIVANPAQVEVNREALAALRILAQLPQTHVAVVSGRALADLAEHTHEAGQIHLVGSHGSEFEAGTVTSLSDESRALLERLLSAVREIAAGFHGATVEIKPASLAFHYRNVEPALAEQAVAAVLAGPAAQPGVFVKHGKMVIELSVVELNKGAALARLRQRLGATAVLFIGDDVTDEDAFATLTGTDLGVKVGTGRTAATESVPDTAEVARLLATVATQRSEWVSGASSVPIEQHSILSDQRTVALVDPNGRISWLCLPRIDSGAIFAELLGGETAGYFEVRSADAARPLSQKYLGDSFVLQTQWPGFVVTDYLDATAGRAFQRAGRCDLLRVVEGRGRVLIRFAPRLDYGRLPTHLVLSPGGVTVDGAPDSMVLAARDLSWEINSEGHHQTATAIVELGERPLLLILRYGTANLSIADGVEPALREANRRFWEGWAGGLRLPTAARELVCRSALLLKALMYGPTGAVAAAATTSLPESIGGVRNWDYRFCWPRDAALAVQALARLGMTGPALKFLDWIMGVAEQHEPGAFVRPVYTVTGHRLSGEGEIGQLAGYRGSRPVRIGNAAAQQVQLDVFGPITDLIATLAERGASVTPDHWQLTQRMVDGVANHWHEPDHGIWEVRLPRRHHTHSKTMCWMTVDRAIRIGEYLGRPRPEWAELRNQIANDVLTHGWNEGLGAFASTYEDALPDAAVLLVGLSGLLPPRDPRFLRTLANVEQQLREGPAVYRYRFDDGLPGAEGGFNLCTAWLIEAYARAGRQDDAINLFEAFMRLAGPTGLISEEFDPHTRQSLGNFPQAYSHLGLINAALTLEDADRA